MQKVVLLMEKKTKQTRLLSKICFFLLVQINIAAVPILINFVRF